MFTEERARWLYEHFCWLERHLPARTGEQKNAVLITPTPEFYPFPKTGDHAFAEAMFGRTRELMGLMEWPCRLVPHVDQGMQQRESFHAGGIMGSLGSEGGAAGTFSVENMVEITYSPTLLSDPMSLVGTLSHELCHYLLATVKEVPPCGWEELEPLTDLAAVHEGFGIFLANSAFAFDQWTNTQNQGWQSSKRGYLTEAELGFALAIFVVRRGLPPESAGRHLKRNPGEVFWDSLEFIDELRRNDPVA
jgi:hypothetical protein